MMKIWVLVLGILLIGFMPIQAEDTGTISIDLKYVDEQETMAISGATVSIYQVWKYDADRKVEMISPFTYSGDTSSINHEMSSKTLQGLVPGFMNQRGSATQTLTTSTDGKLVFENLPEGAYLVVQEEPVVDENGNYYYMSPFLVTIPYRQDVNQEFLYNPKVVNEDDQQLLLQYHLDAAPKFRLQKSTNVLKIDQNTKKVLPGATLVITDRSGNVVNDMYGERCEWVTGEEKKTFFLPTGEYILKETIVPKGYVKAKDIPFRVDEYYQVFVVDGSGNESEASSNDIIMEDPIAPPPTTTPPRTNPPTTRPPYTPPNTGDNFNLPLYGALFAGALLIQYLLIRKLKKDSNL